MKLKIPIFASGGTYIPPFVSFTPVPRPTRAHASAAAVAPSSSASSGKIAEKDIMKMLDKMEGLPVDMERIKGLFDALYYDNFNDPFGISDTSSLASTYMQLLMEVKEAKFNKEEYDNAYKQVAENGGLAEVAVTQEGLYVAYDKDDKNYKFVSPYQMKESFDEDGDSNYTLLTNSDLLSARAHDSRYAFNNSFLSTIQQGVGMEVVTKTIDDIIKGLGTSEKDDEIYFNSKGAFSGLQAITDGNMKALEAGVGRKTASQLYELGYITKNQLQEAQQALMYIWQTLPANQRSVLMSKCGFDEKKAFELISDYISSKIDTTEKMDSGSGKENSSDPMDNPTPLQMMHNQWGGTETRFRIDVFDGVEMGVRGQIYSALKRGNGEIIGDCSAREMLNESGMIEMYDGLKPITFGDKKITRDELRYIAYQGDGVVRTMLPINESGMVDFSLLEDYKAAEDEIIALGENATLQQKMAIYQNHKISKLFKPNGEPDPQYMQEFLIFRGLATPRYCLDIDKDTKVNRPADGNGDDKALAKEWQTIISKSIGDESGDKKFKIPLDYNSVWPGDWFGLWDKIYSGCVYIPIDADYAWLGMLDGRKYTMDEMNYLEGSFQKRDVKRNQNSTKTSDLGLNK